MKSQERRLNIQISLAEVRVVRGVVSWGIGMERLREGQDAANGWGWSTSLMSHCESADPCLMARTTTVARALKEFLERERRSRQFSNIALRPLLLVSVGSRMKVR